MLFYLGQKEQVSDDIWAETEREEENHVNIEEKAYSTEIIASAKVLR